MILIIKMKEKDNNNSLAGLLQKDLLPENSKMGWCNYFFVIAITTLLTKDGVTDWSAFKENFTSLFVYDFLNLIIYSMVASQLELLGLSYHFLLRPRFKPTSLEWYIIFRKLSLLLSRPIKPLTEMFPEHIV